MTEKQIKQAIAKIEKAARRRHQSALASCRKIARLKDQARKARVRVLIKTGAEFLALPDRTLTTPEVQNLRTQAEEDLDGIQPVLDLDAGSSPRKQHKSGAEGSPLIEKPVEAPVPVAAGVPKIVLGFFRAPTQDLCRELRRLKLDYGTEEAYRWTGEADPDVVRAKIHEFGSDHLVKVFEVRAAG